MTGYNKTVKDHEATAKALAEHLLDANALVFKLRDQLVLARDVIEKMGEAAHPKLDVDLPYTMRDRDSTTMTGPALAKRAAAKISETLGDRA